MFDLVKKYEEYALMILGAVIALLIFYVMGTIYHYIVDPKVELDKRDKVVEINKVKVWHINNILADSKIKTERRLSEINSNSDSNITNWVW